MTLVIFYGLGLLLSFTPCILPMIPVLSGIIAGQNNLNTNKAFRLSLSYVLSMSLTYASVGAIVSQLGVNLQIIMQSPWAIGSFSALFVILALSMFGLFELKLPDVLQNRLLKLHRSRTRGFYISAVVMGCLSTLILSPCVTAPLIAILSYIATTGHIFFGSVSLFVLSLGMGTPLLVIGTSAGKLIPKAGKWMNTVKYFFGIMLLCIALLLAVRLFPNTEHTVHTVAGIRQEMAKAKGKIVILDFSASWCSSCQEVDKNIFKNPEIQKRIKDVVVIKVDLSTNGKESDDIYAKYKIIAPPVIIFLNGKGLESARLSGDISVQTFLASYSSLK